MKIKRSPMDPLMILEISGKIMGGPDHDRFKDEINSLLEGGYKDIILDMDGVPWINSTGLGILISGFHSLKNAEGSMKICRVKERVLSIFYISQLENIFQVFPDTKEAVDSYGE
ncbi:MAG: STAS domain-containing protein [Gemmatimonadales bacterium]|nr:STAS domain-containing protein [Gemmatimonadales bacterium]